MSNTTRRIAATATTALMALIGIVIGGCEMPPPAYGKEHQLHLTGVQPHQVWAVAPAINLSGQHGVDPLLQADALYMQLQQVNGLTVIPVNRVVEAYAGLKIDSVQSPEQAAMVCDVLGCDALVVPTVTVYDPYNPPKVGASLQLFRKPHDSVRPVEIDPRELSRAVAPPADEAPVAAPQQFIQSVGMFDATNGSVRSAVEAYAQGRSEPGGPMGWHEYLVSMDRYSGFVYNALTIDLLRSMASGS